jgi:hypothetical protein
VILPNGRFCLIRDKYVDALGDLVVEVEYWRDEADHSARPQHPREAHEHGFTVRDKLTGARIAISPSFDVLGMLLNSMAPCTREDGHTAIVRRERHAGDPHGYLSHPHVQALEVTARV